MKKILGPEVSPISNKPPKQLVVILHGVGADGANLIDLASEFQDILPEAYFIAPNAPFLYENAPTGYQWFSLSDRSEEALVSGMKMTAPIINSFIDEQLTRFQLGAEQLVLIGFSQGTMLSLYTALRRPQKIAAVIGFSGILLGTTSLSEEIRSRPPILLIHGDQDEIVPFSAMIHAEKLLKKLSVPVNTYSCQRLGHSISMEGIKQAKIFLKNIV